MVSDIKEKTLDNFSLDDFEGPLELLLFLVQKEEVDVEEIDLLSLAKQLDEKSASALIDQKAGWLALTATLLLLKSKSLIPGEEVDEEELPRVELFQKLLDYSTIQETVKTLTHQEESQKYLFPRGHKQETKPLSSGLEELSLEELSSLLQGILDRAPKQKIVEQERWEVSDKQAFLREHLREGPLLFTALFSEKSCRLELVVTFLALLELMKIQEVRVVRREEIYVEST